MLVANTTLGQHRVNIVKLPIMLNETNMISAKQDLTSLITFFFFWLKILLVNFNYSNTHNVLTVVLCLYLFFS